MKTVLILCLVTLIFSQSNNGKFFDTGIEMDKPAPNAPTQLAFFSNLIGSYTVDVYVFNNDRFEKHEAHSSIRYFNRGSGFMERTVFDDKSEDGLQHEEIALLTYVPSVSAWNYGIVDNIKENVILFDGKISKDTLILHQGIRKNGGAQLSLLRIKRINSDKNNFRMIFEESLDYGQSYKTFEKREYSRTKSMNNSLMTSNSYGRPFKNRKAESSQFDFLIGEASATHNLTLPNGQNVKFPTNATAVYVLGGNAIMEFNWFDLDPNNPNNATTIIRIYNRAMRRWESLFTTNRSHNQLHFGGKKEGNDIILTFFNTNTNVSRYSFFVFHSITNKGYKWYSNTTNDHGKTFSKNWIIEVTKNE